MEFSKEKNTQLLKDIFCCPLCHGELSIYLDYLSCAKGGHGPFKFGDGKVFLIKSQDGANYQEQHLSGVNYLKSFLKKYPKLYYLTWYIFCPVLLSGKRPKSIVKLLPLSAKIVNLGSGPRRLHSSFINVDIVPFKEVDIIADATKLPFKDSSLDAVVNEAFLEHVPDPISVITEIKRVLKPGGLLYVSVPFLAPYHGSPDDFTRWTRSGLRSLLFDFKVIEDGVDGGPWSALLVFMAYWLGVILSFGSKKLAPFFAFLFMLILGPLKIFDFIFARMPGSDAVATQLYFIGEKKVN